MNSLSLTIVIPVYNEENYLENCLKSIAGQDLMPDEVIVVDNNSTDRSCEIAKKYPFVRVIKEKKQGIVFARNAGFNQAKSDIIGRIDADTVLASGWVRYVKNKAQYLDDFAAVTGPCTFYDYKYGRTLFAFHRVIYFWLSRFSFGHTILFGSNLFLFRKNWDSIKSEACINNNIHEDMDLAAHIFKNGGEIVFDKNLMASISSRRFSNWKCYPTKWTRTWTIHGLIPKFYQLVRRVYNGSEY